MFKMILIILLTLSTTLKAETFKTGILFNYHTFVESKRFANKINNKLVYSNYYFQLDKKNLSLVLTTDCMGQITHSVIFNKEIKYNIKLFAGYYIIKTDKWHDFYRYWIIQNNGFGVVPHLGILKETTLYKNKEFKIELINTLTPALIQSLLLLSFNI